jgi:aryl-alcohol dehydrogenase-like predicted oxidoreductase
MALSNRAKIRRKLPRKLHARFSRTTTTMQIRSLGNTGISVSAIGFGAMPLSIAGRPSEKEAIAVIHAALEAGMTLVDTADVYCFDHRDIGHNERLVAQALRTFGGSQDVLVATKGGLERPNGDWTVNGHPGHLRTACEASLKALGVDNIALYQLHAPDDRVPFADSVGALADLKAEGKITHIGLSNVSVHHIVAAQKITSITSVQNRCNPFERYAFTTGVVSACAEQKITFLAHSPVGGHRGHSRTESDPTLCAVGARCGLTPYQVCLAWLLAASPELVAIPGASRPVNARSSAAAAGATLSSDDLATLSRTFPI